MSIGDTVRDITAQLATLEGATDEISRMRRITLNDALADYLYGMSDILKQQGRNAEADKAHSLANQHWSAVMSDAADFNE